MIENLFSKIENLDSVHDNLCKITIESGQQVAIKLSLEAPPCGIAKQFKPESMQHII